MRAVASSLWIAGVAACLGACAQAPAVVSAPPSTLPALSAAPCDAAAAQFAVGRSADATLEQQVRERSGARVVRLLRPGQMVTKEFRADRINLELDTGNRVTAVRCG